MSRISLVVDDEPAVRKFITTILRRENFETVEAEDGAHGLRIVQELGDDVALIVSDIQMPDGDGLTFAHAVKAAFPAMPILLVSGAADPGPEFPFVHKPFMPAALLDAVRKLVPEDVSVALPTC